MKRFATYCLSAILALSALDAYLQLSGIQTPMETRIDPRLGPTYIPKMPITRFNEGFYVGAANNYGYMGPTVEPRKTGDEARVLLMGDSFVLGHTVLPRHHFARTLESQLSERTRTRVHALNFGKADFNLWNMYQYHHDFASSFDHEVSLFFVDEGDLVPARQIATDLYPGITLRNDTLVIDTRFTTSGTYHFYKKIDPLLTHSAVLRLAFNSFKMVKRGELAGVILGRLAPAPATAALSSPPAEELPELSRVILCELAKNPNNALVIHKSLTPDLREDIDATRIPVIDLSACFDSLQQSGFDPYYWPVTGMHGHWNHATHTIIGNFLADELLRLHLLSDMSQGGQPDQLRTGTRDPESARDTIR